LNINGVLSCADEKGMYVRLALHQVYEMDDEIDLPKAIDGKTTFSQLKVIIYVLLPSISKMHNYVSKHLHL